MVLTLREKNEIRYRVLNTSLLLNTSIIASYKVYTCDSFNKPMGLIENQTLRRAFQNVPP